ncbi:serine/threonine-protein kinase [Serratia fonticola]|uniref:serine/threonine protein kinase n=1 Tax=Serratia fonticola TaxID=47917 RepID=UPI003AAF389D
MLTTWAQLTPGCRAHALQPGYRLAQLEIQRAIGEGGFSIVYQAFDHRRKCPVAIKEYMPTAIAMRDNHGNVIPRNAFLSSVFDSGRECFHQEAKILAGLSHPCIPPLLAFWQQNNTAYISTTLYDGDNLKKLYAKNPAVVTLPWLKALIASLLDTVNTLHLQGCLHLDISWDNIQIPQSAPPILLDFGSACFAGAERPKKTNIVLKPGFSPAELYCHGASNGQGPWSDIYSLGALMYTLITGQLPPASMIRSIEDRYFPLVEQLPSGYCRQFLQSIDCALEVNAANRPQTITTFARQLGISLS